MPPKWHYKHIVMHITCQNYTLEVVQEAIFLRLSEFQQQKQIQWGNLHTIQYHDKCNVIRSWGRSGGIVSQRQSKWTNQSQPWWNGSPTTGKQPCRHINPLQMGQKMIPSRNKRPKLWIWRSIEYKKYSVRATTTCFVNKERLIYLTLSTSQLSPNEPSVHRLSK